MDSNWIGILYIFVMLLFFGLIFSLIITVIKFARQKKEQNKQVLNKLDELIQLQKKNDIPPKDK